MIMRITDVGESCPDPDRYIQTISAESVASYGVKQNQDIIIKPDVPLLIGMTAILVIAVVTVMVGVGYCLHKGWSISKVAYSGYRKLYYGVDIDHKNTDTFYLNNDFAKTPNKYDPNLSEEDDLDDLNLEI